MKACLLALPIFAAASACATSPDPQEPSIAYTLPVFPEGSTVALGNAVAVADIVVTPLRVTEDSRCPINARCIWAGEIKVETRIEQTDWRETVELTLGQPETVRGHTLALVSAEPGQMAGGDPILPEQYRFSFEQQTPD